MCVCAGDRVWRSRWRRVGEQPGGCKEHRGGGRHEEQAHCSAGGEVLRMVPVGFVSFALPARTSFTAAVTQTTTAPAATAVQRSCAAGWRR